MLSSVGGEAFTLATDGFGSATTIAGSVYTIATSKFAEATDEIG